MVAMTKMSSLPILQLKHHAMWEVNVEVFALFTDVAGSISSRKLLCRAELVYNRHRKWKRGEREGKTKKEKEKEGGGGRKKN
jgi:hypothetical protein